MSAWRRKKKRLSLLLDTEKLLRDWEYRLRCAAPPITEWIASAAVQYTALPFLSTVAERLSYDDLETAWRTAVGETDGFAAEDIALLETLGAVLGKSNKETQSKCVEQVLAGLYENVTRARADAEKACKLYVGLGSCVGMAMALLLV